MLSFLFAYIEFIFLCIKPLIGFQTPDVILDACTKPARIHISIPIAIRPSMCFLHGPVPWDGRVLGVPAPDGSGPDDGVSTPDHQLGQVGHHPDRHVSGSVTSRMVAQLRVRPSAQFTGWLTYCVAACAETYRFCFYEDRYIYARKDPGRWASLLHFLSRWQDVLTLICRAIEFYGAAERNDDFYFYWYFRVRTITSLWNINLEYNICIKN